MKPIKITWKRSHLESPRAIKRRTGKIVYRPLTGDYLYGEINERQAGFDVLITLNAGAREGTEIERRGFATLTAATRWANTRIREMFE